MFEQKIPRTSHERYNQRIEKWKKWMENYPGLKNHFWWITHNCFAHVLIGLFPIKPFFDFHDWTSNKINSIHITEKYRNSLSRN